MPKLKAGKTPPERSSPRGHPVAVLMVIKATVTDEVTKQVLVASEDTTRIPIPIEPGDVMVIRYVTSIKLSKNFQSIGLEIGFVEYPVKAGTDPEEAFEEVFAKVEDMLVQKTKDLEETLNTLGAKKK